MKIRIFLIAFLGFLSFNSFSQISFENGYFINNSDEKINVLIRDLDWKNNPSVFEYKISEEAPVQKSEINEIKEFGVPENFRFIRATVDIDRSGEALINLTEDRNPAFQEETLFLEVLVDGKASLYGYKDGTLKRYFYRISDSPINQLIYKSYVVDYGKKIAENNTFRQQLSQDLNCESEPGNQFRNVDYNKNGLKKVFINFNECTNSEYAVFEQQQKRDIFNLSLRPGLNFSSLEVKNMEDPARNTDFGSQMNFRFGIELEFILPYNKNKWGIIIEPTYHNFTAEKTVETDKIFGGSLTSEVDYESIEFPIGIRHYFFLSENSKIFADVTYIIEHANDSNITFTWYNGTLQEIIEIKPRPNVGFGLGFKFNEYSLSARYQTTRNVIGNYTFWDANYESFSVILGYSLF